VRVDKDITVDYGVKADASGFEKLIRSLDTIANVTISDPMTAAEDQALEDSQNLLKEAMDEIRVIENGIARNTKRLDDAKQRHESFINFASDQVDKIENIDPAQVITELNAASVQIEASYITISQIQSLSLANFIR
jgi:flagellar hook-associated protein 3 FlgL